jgi:hypothetical protein
MFDWPPLKIHPIAMARRTALLSIARANASDSGSCAPRA